MDFVARHPALKSGRGVAAKRLAEIYQQLGLAWEFLALQCAHESGFSKMRDGKRTCRTCGTLEDATERWVLLPRTGKKQIGQRRFPDAVRTFPSRKAATLVDDSLAFHGATIRVRVQNAYRSSLFRRHAITIAADRMVDLCEGGVECGVDTHMVRVRLRPRKKGVKPPYGALVSELSRKELGRFPLLVEYDDGGELVGVCIFRPGNPTRTGSGIPVELAAGSSAHGRGRSATRRTA